MRRTICFLLLSSLAAVTSVLASDVAKVALPADWQTRSEITNLDDPQPDTLLYDNNSPAVLNTGTNYWCYVRFTAPVDFNIISAYMYAIDGTNSQAPCSVFVYSQLPAPGANPLGWARQAPPLPNFGWIDVNFNDTISVAGGSDFWVVFGPVPGGPQGDNNWNPVWDNAITGNRSQLSTQGRTGTYSVITGDWLMRIGGTLGNTFIDLAAGDLYDDVNGDGPAFNFLPGGEVELTQIVENVGTATVAAYTVELQVTGPGGGVIFTDELVGVNIADGATQNLTANQTFVATTEGEYLCRSVMVATDDVSAENDTTWLRFFVGANHRWYRYDDNEDAADSHIGFNTGSGWCISYTPVVYPAKITQLKVEVGGAATGDIRIFANDETGVPTGEAVWSATPALVAGWNTLTVNPPLVVFEGSFTVCNIWQTGITMGYDDTPPNSAENASMGIIAYQYGNGQFFEDDGGNLCMQAYVDTSSATPPFPVIATSHDTMDFGTLNPNDGASAVISLWIYNEGGVDPLNVTGMVINPPAIRAAYTLSQTAFSVAAGDSEEVLVTFDPVTHRAYNGLLAINNNSNNNQAYGVILRGMGDSTVSVNEIDLPLPREYSLSQNFPNPFNPETQINFMLPMSSEVRLTVVNMLGQEVALLASGRFGAGTYSAAFDGSNLPSGLYFYRLDAGNFTSTRKMMLMK